MWIIILESLLALLLLIILVAWTMFSGLKNNKSTNTNESKKDVDDLPNKQIEQDKK